MDDDSLHGVTLEIILTRLVEKCGWEDMSSLTFLRRTPWAREKVENLYRSRGL